jgi:Ca2+-binding EF-hand superfamily protein
MANVKLRHCLTSLDIGPKISQELFNEILNSIDPNQAGYVDFDDILDNMLLVKEDSQIFND